MINNVLKAKQQEYGEVFREVRFPLLVSNIINSAPSSRIDAVFFTIMAVLSVYSTRLRLSYFYDSYLSGCQLQVFVIGDQSCGKGSIDNIQSRLIEKLLIRDERSRKLEEAYKEQIRHLSDKAKSKITPPSVCVLVLPPSTSRHKICVRASEIHKVYNDTLFFYMSTPELGTVLDANRLAFSDLRTISRLSYDLGAIYGQEHGGADGFTGLVNINVSFLLLGTAHALHRYFNSSALLDGNISRSIIVNIPTEIGENPPYFKPLSDMDNATIDTVLDKLINNIFDDENNVLKDTVQPDLGFLYHHVNNFQEVASAEAVMMAVAVSIGPMPSPPTSRWPTSSPYGKWILVLRQARCPLRRTTMATRDSAYITSASALAMNLSLNMVAHCPYRPKWYITPRGRTSSGA